MCWTFLSSCLLLEPDTFRQSRVALVSMGSALQRVLAIGRDTRSLCARTASPRSVRASRLRRAGVRFSTRPKSSSVDTILEARDSKNVCVCICKIHTYII